MGQHANRGSDGTGQVFPEISPGASDAQNRQIGQRFLAQQKSATAAPPAPCPAAHSDTGEDPSRELAAALDRAAHYSLSRVTLGLSPMALSVAYFDWLIHLAGSPDKQLQLWQQAIDNSIRLARYSSQCLAHDRFGTPPCIAPQPNDKRFVDENWQIFPFNFIHQAFLLNQQWWNAATTGVRGVSDHHTRVMEFSTR